MIIALLGGLARQQADQMGRLVMGIYDHSFVGMLYVSQTEAEFLRLIAGHDTDGAIPTAATREAIDHMLDRLDVAMERAGSAHTRAVGAQVREILAGLPDTPAADRPERVALADRAIARLVRSYSSDGLEGRDNADELASHNSHLVMIVVGTSLTLAVGLGLLLGRNLSPPLEDLVRSIGRLAEGDLGHQLAPRLSLRRDEIGAVARATSFFREAMLKNIAAGEERARLEEGNEAVRLDAERSEAAMAAKADFLATMSHEIRTPMNGVSTVADLLADTDLSTDQLKMVDIIRQSSKWLIRVINDILDLSKLEANQLQIERVPFMLDEVLDGACQVLAAKAREKGLVLTLEGRDLLGVCRIGDPLRLRQIVLNLLGNAVKFTAAGSVTLTVQADPGGIVLSVIDTGIGIPEDKIDSLFQPYNQVRSDIARSYGGTGLGLSITKNLVGLMGGSLEVTSEVGRGSRFAVNLNLPCDSSSLCKASNRSVASRVRWQKPDLAAAAAQGAVVLCAEDNAINREVLGRVLDRLGFSYEMVGDGYAALALLDPRRHCVILTDAQMPGLDGWQLTQAVRRREADQHMGRLPIMMLTADGLIESDSRALAVGIDTVLTKPLNVDVLEAALLGAVPALAELRVVVGVPPSDPPDEMPGSKGLGTQMSPTAIDLEVLVQLVGDDPDTLCAMLNDFQAGVIAQYDQIRAALAQNDRTVLARIAHSIKGAARYAGATNLSQICDVLEQRANQTATFEDMAEVLVTLNMAVAQLPAEVAAALAWRTAAANL